MMRGMLEGTLSGIGSVQAGLTGTATLQAGLTIPSVSDVPVFAGEYEYTPDQSVQVINIAHMQATQDIVINPIPNNYGLITWNGSIITVS